MPGMPGMPGAGGGKRGKKPAPKKGKGKRVSGNPAKAAAQKKAQAEKASASGNLGGNPFGDPDAEPVDYEQAAAALDLPKDFSKYLK
jgi:signal recognition particle subunit SRP54